MTRVLAGLFVGLIVLSVPSRAELLPDPPRTSAAAVPPRNSLAITPFTLSEDPAEAVLRLSFAAATTPSAVEWAVYGDGRLEKVEKYTGDPTRRREMRLTKEQIYGLVRHVIAYGLADANEQGLDTKIAAGWGETQTVWPAFTPLVPPPPEDIVLAAVEK